MPPHVDLDDLILCVLTFGDFGKDQGGGTFYMDGLKSGKMVPDSFHEKNMK